MFYSRREFGKMAISAVTAGKLAIQTTLGGAPIASTSNLKRNLKWSYMDHWSMRSARGWISPQLNVRAADRFIKQIVGVGFQGLDPFDFRLNQLIQIFGSAKKVEEFAQERGIERIVNVFGNGPIAMPHLRETHDAGVKAFEDKIKLYDGIDIDTLIVMPGARYWLVEPVTDEKLKMIADLWNRIGRMTMEERGIKLSCHHEFYCCIHYQEEIDKFYSYADPRYVFFFLDTAQHQIAGVDPVDLYIKYHDRVAGFHFKDTHYVDRNNDFRTPPDPERVASTTARWFWEMGTPQGLVDFPRLMKALKDFNYKGWVTAEHDKAEIAGANYAESTCRAKWYIDNVLSKVYA